MFAVVNGYPCMSSCDVAVARLNIDPHNPHDNPVRAEQLAEADLMKGKQPAGAQRPNPVGDTQAAGPCPAVFSM
jgi:hypothetical protein